MKLRIRRKPLNSPLQKQTLKRLVAVGEKGTSLLPKDANIEVLFLNQKNLMSWQRYGGREEEIFHKSLKGEISDCRQTDYCLFVGYAQSKNNSHKRREVWIGTLQEALKRDLVRRCRLLINGDEITGYISVNPSADQYIATSALPGGRIELEPCKDNKGFERNSSITLSRSSVTICRIN